MSDPTRPPWEPERSRPAPYVPPSASRWEEPNPYEQPYPPSGGYGQPYPYPQPNAMVYAQPVDPRGVAYPQLYAPQKSRLAAGLLAIFLGSLGIHNFYLGRTGLAVLQLLLTVLTLGILGALVGIWALVEGILILTGSPSFSTDARGIPLRD